MLVEDDAVSHRNKANGASKGGRCRSGSRSPVKTAGGVEPRRKRDTKDRPALAEMSPRKRPAQRGAMRAFFDDDSDEDLSAPAMLRSNHSSMTRVSRDAEMSRSRGGPPASARPSRESRVTRSTRSRSRGREEDRRSGRSPHYRGSRRGPAEEAPRRRPTSQSPPWAESQPTVREPAEDTRASMERSKETQPPPEEQKSSQEMAEEGGWKEWSAPAVSMGETVPEHEMQGDTPMEARNVKKERLEKFRQRMRERRGTAERSAEEDRPASSHGSRREERSSVGQSRSPGEDGDRRMSPSLRSRRRYSRDEPKTVSKAPAQDKPPVAEAAAKDSERVKRDRLARFREKMGARKAQVTAAEGASQESQGGDIVTSAGATMETTHVDAGARFVDLVQKTSGAPQKTAIKDIPWEEMEPKDFGFTEQRNMHDLDLSTRGETYADRDRSLNLFKNVGDGEERFFSDDEQLYTEGTKPEGYFEMLKKGIANKKELKSVDHSKITYEAFKKNLYVQVREITQLTDQEVDALRKTHGNIQVRGKKPPRPITSFYQCGLPDKILHLLELRSYEAPFPIQMQAIPALMSGRDIMAIAETGSGKTLAYSLPMLRHVGAQRSCKDGEGMIGLVIAPTRELAVQIYQEANKFCKVINIRCTAVYGGAGIGDQLSKLRRGCEIVVCTPGRLIDVLTISNGKVTNLRRVTMVVLDEADRMFDLGFEPQITMVLKNVRPDAQVSVFSATFPSHIESLVRRILRKPVEIVVGEKGTTAKHITQYVEVRSEKSKLPRLLQLLGEWHEHGSIIVFVDKQVEADTLYAQLLNYGYTTYLLHGGLDQVDREFTIQDFKDGKKDVNILIATSVAARGLDVKSVVLVVNYVVPDHMEDYVHRIGRTGRAGNLGVAFTFITPEEKDKADDLVKALTQSSQEVPPILQQMAEDFKSQCHSGFAKQRRLKGFGGRGFTFKEKSRQQQEREEAKKELGIGTYDEDEEDEDAANAADAAHKQQQNSLLVAPCAPVITEPVLVGAMSVPSTGFSPANAGADGSTASQGILLTDHDLDIAAQRMAENSTKHLENNIEDRRKQIELMKPGLKIFLSKNGQYALNLLQSVQGQTPGAAGAKPAHFLQKVPGLGPNGYIDPATGNCVDEFEINNYPQIARQKISQKDQLMRISELCNVGLQIRGQHIAEETIKNNPVAAVRARKLYIEIVGPTAVAVQRAKHEVKTTLDQISMKTLNMQKSAASTGKYTVC